MRSIRLSPKHGVNPSLSACYFCGGDKNELVLPGLLPNDAEAPRRAVWNREPCDTCKGYMAQGIILISVRDGESGDDPYRTGNMAVISEDAARRMLIEGPTRDAILRKRVAFIEDRTWSKLGLPAAGEGSRGGA